MYASLWVIKDAKMIHENKILWVFMDMNIRIGINHKPRLSRTIYNSLQSFEEFKLEMHNIYIRAHKDLTKEWIKLLFVAIDNGILMY